MSIALNPRRSTRHKPRRKVTRSKRRNPMSFGTAAKRDFGTAMRTAWKSIKRRNKKPRRVRGRVKYNPDLGASLKTAGAVGLGYAAAMIGGSTVTERLFPALPDSVKIAVRSLVGCGIGYVAEMTGRDATDIFTGSLLYGMVKETENLLAGRNLPFIKTGLEAAALPAPVAAGATSGYVRAVGEFVPDRPLSLNPQAVANRLRSRFNRG